MTLDFERDMCAQHVRTTCAHNIIINQTIQTRIVGPSDKHDVLETGSSLEKIKILSELDTADNPETIQKVIERLDDDDLQVRGEAFSSLILNENGKVYDHLISSLRSASKNIRGFASLVLANRHEKGAIPELVRAASDGSSLVRSCAIGALGYLNALDKGSLDAMLHSLLDESMEVRKSAAHSLIITKASIPAGVIDAVSKKWEGDARGDPDLEVLLGRLKRLPVAS